MDTQTRRGEALRLMAQFADLTGVSSHRSPQRYLWTDAFAVCNWLGLDRVTEVRHSEIALRLVDQVHHVLGQHRPDDRRTGWISGLAPHEGEAHPTRGGLRIGKPLPEREPRVAVDERLEWERDGQYFHYLTKWMYALDQLTRHTGQPLFNRWACELAEAAHRTFVYTPRPGGPKRMYWKLSIDLLRPLVASMGQHDALDGLLTYTQMEATAAEKDPSLRNAIAEFAAMVDPAQFATADPLGIGGLLVDAYRALQLERQGSRVGVLEDLLVAAELGLRQYSTHSDLRLPATHRLAFRELGLAIGLAALERPEWSAMSPAVRTRIDRLLPYMPLRNAIETFWLQPEHRDVEAWTQHLNINDVMLATSLEPSGFLVIPAVLG